MTAKRRKLYPAISRDDCKGCGRCVYSCPKKVIQMEDALNSMGYRYASILHEGDECVGCGSCFYSCPEPGAITIMEETLEQNEAVDGEEENKRACLLK